MAYWNPNDVYTTMKGAGKGKDKKPPMPGKGGKKCISL
jgi:hypothetical protein